MLAAQSDAKNRPIPIETETQAPEDRAKRRADHDSAISAQLARYVAARGSRADRMPSDKRTSGGTRRLSISRYALLVTLSSSLLVGCGGSGAHSAGGSSTQPRTTSTRAVGTETPAVIAVAVDACRRGADTAHWLSRASKQQLYTMCERGRNSGIAVIAESAKEVCGEVAFTSPFRSAAKRARVLGECQATANAGTAAP